MLIRPDHTPLADLYSEVDGQRRRIHALHLQHPDHGCLQLYQATPLTRLLDDSSVIVSRLAGYINSAINAPLAPSYDSLTTLASQPLDSHQTLIIPPLWQHLHSQLDSSQLDNLRQFVHNGGTLVMFASAYFTSAVNTLFGWSLEIDNASTGVCTLNSGAPAEYSDLPTQLSATHVRPLDSLSLPPHHQRLYDLSVGGTNQLAVARLQPLAGDGGYIYYLGWSWDQDQTPAGPRADWNQLLNQLLSQAPA